MAEMLEVNQSNLDEEARGVAYAKTVVDIHRALVEAGKLAEPTEEPKRHRLLGGEDPVF